MDTNITQIIEAIASSQPEAPAIHVPGRTTLRYVDLGEQIRYVRERLSSWGIQPGDVVAAALPSRPEMAVAIATLPSSCTFAPLDPSLPSEAYAQLLRRMKAKAVLVTSRGEHAIRAAARLLGIAEIDMTPERDAAAGLFTLTLGRAGTALAAGNSKDPRLACILTSSGTTGRPKLVPTEHRVVLSYASAIRDWLDFTPADVGVHITPVYLGNGLRSGLLNALLAGRSLALLPVADIEALFASIEEFRPTFLTANFSLFRGILRRAPEFRAEIAQSRFRFMRWAGRVDLEDADRLEQLFEAPMLTGLSSTETSRISHDPLPPRRRKRGSVGLPIINEVALLDGAGNILPNGGAGEILVRGPLVFPGYLDDPELTAASFLGDWFRTGDLGRIDEDGYVYFVGRIKDIINRGGEKISPIEIDLAIESLPGVKEAAVFAIPHPSLGEEMVAAVVREENAAIDEAQVVERVRARAGVRKVPRRVYFVERLPRTDNGKLRRSALPELLSLDQVAAARSPAPSGADTGFLSPLEGALAGLWSSLLQVVSVGRDDDFFLLGGDSLRGMQLIAHLKKLFGVDLSILSLFGEAATVAGMARAVEIARAGERAVDRRPDRETGQAADAAKRPRLDRGPVVLAHAQLRMWFLAQLNPGTPVYNETRAHRLSGSINAAAMRESLRAVMQRHEVLRTTFALVDGEPRQVVHSAAGLDFEYLDLAATSTDDQEGELLTLIAAEGQRPFDLERGPLARFRLIHLADGDHVLLRVWHHIVSDGWSAWVFERELSSTYNARVKGETGAPPALGMQYADYALWQRAYLTEAELDRHLGYWREQLKELGTLELPTDRRRPAVQSHNGARLDVPLPGELVAGMRALGRTEGATLFMTGLAAFLVLLHRHGGTEDIAVGTPIAGRRRAELEELIGFFANTLVLRASLAGEPSFRVLLARVRACALEAYEHQDLPFEKLVEELDPSRDLSRTPLFQVCFALQNEPAATLQLEGAQASRVVLARHNAKFDLALTLREAGQGLQASWEYCTDLFDAPTIERMAGHFQVLLDAIVAHPDQRIGTLPLLTAAERHHLLVEWNDTAADYPRDRCIHQLLEDQAARTPGAVAVVCEDRHLTYAELNARANKLAHHLRTLGVGPNVLVALCLERSPEMVVGLLGILKAGGAYVPLDPSYPPARLAFMLADTHTPVLLTQQGLLGQLPPYDGHLLCLDRDWPTILGQPSTDPPPCPAIAESLAYVIYTSGSTGTPKGVPITHGSLLNLVCWHQQAYEVTAADRATQIAGAAFDAVGWELWPYLTAGASVYIADDTTRLDPARLVRWLLEQRITLSFVPTPLAEAALRESWPQTTALRVLLTGGDRLTQRPAKRLGFRVINHYGPTENTVVSTCGEVEAADAAPTAPSIGRPLPNTRAYVVDSHLQVVPIGVPGELLVGGAQLAIGYWNRPELTAEKFVPDPFAAEPMRLYRTGDLARYLPDGNIEFLGRIDRQIKIRGHRVELGEVEATLAGHPTVGQAVAMFREDSPGDARLVAYVVANEGASSEAGQRNATSEWSAEHISEWRELYEQTYAQSSSEDPTFNITGWNSSYTGAPIPAQEMREWLDATVERISARRPCRVLEIGCGTGLLLARLAPACQVYRGVDFSVKALDHVRSLIAARRDLAHVELSQRTADDFTGIEPGSFDTVIINSVTQYLPGIEYLKAVLEQAVAAVSAGGRIFIGDVRNFTLLRAFHTSVRCHREEGGTNKVQLRRLIENDIELEGELVIDPAFFVALKDGHERISDLEILLKRGRYQNELTRFRYDVFLHVEAKDAAFPPPTWVDWQQARLSLADLPRYLAPSPRALGIRSVPNARWEAAAKALDWLASEEDPQTLEGFREARASASDAAVDPEALWSLAEQYGFALEVGYSSAGTPCMDVLFRSRDAMIPGGVDWGRRAGAPTTSWGAYSNNPLKGKLVRDLIPQLRKHLADALPEYMVPAAFVMLTELPLTPNGKVDRRALPPPGVAAYTSRAYEAPVGEIETTLAQIWAEVLKIERVGRHDNFFELGGHSLLATQLVARIARHLQIEVPLRRMFEAPTIAALVGDVARVRRATDETARDRILREVEALTDEEAAHELDGSRSAGNPG